MRRILIYHFETPGPTPACLDSNHPEHSWFPTCKRPASEAEREGDIERQRERERESERARQRQRQSASERERER